MRVLSLTDLCCSARFPYKRSCSAADERDSGTGSLQPPYFVHLIASKYWYCPYIKKNRESNILPYYAAVVMQIWSVLKLIRDIICFEIVFSVVHGHSVRVNTGKIAAGSARSGVLGFPSCSLGKQNLARTPHGVLPLRGLGFCLFFFFITVSCACGMRLTFPPSSGMGYSSSWTALGGEKRGLSLRRPIRPAVPLARADACWPSSLIWLSKSVLPALPAPLEPWWMKWPWNRAALLCPSACAQTRGRITAVGRQEQWFKCNLKFLEESECCTGIKQLILN